jgi:hypothetical protein
MQCLSGSTSCVRCIGVKSRCIDVRSRRRLLASVHCCWHPPGLPRYVIRRVCCPPLRNLGLHSTSLLANPYEYQPLTARSHFSGALGKNQCSDVGPRLVYAGTCKTTASRAACHPSGPICLKRWEMREALTSCKHTAVYVCSQCVSISTSNRPAPTLVVSITSLSARMQ